MFDTIDSIDVPRLHKRLGELFRLKNLTKPQMIHGGRRCLNMRVESDSGAFFLKKYRQSVSETVHEVKYAEKFYFDHGIPVIMPLPDIHERFAFWFDGNWYSLFPYINGVTASADPSTTTLQSMGHMLGTIHTIGTPFYDINFTPLRLWDWRRFYPQYAELIETFERMQKKTPVCEQAVELLNMKERVIRNHTYRPQDVRLAFNTLCHGDFIFSNVFINPQGEVTHTYDFEMTRRGPRAFDFARSMFINCFDDGWGEKQLARAKVFAGAYLKEVPMSLTELVEGIRLYLTFMTYSTWIEADIIQSGKNHADILVSHRLRIEHMNDDWEEFCRQMTVSP